MELQTTDSTVPTKYVLMLGGTVSGLGKGTSLSSIGAVLRSLGFRVTAIKIDPYLNVDAGTMSPFEHGEVYVLEDGGEVDLDLGNYERFLDITLTSDHNITTGKIYQQVLSAEREGHFLGSTVQVVPHITDAIQNWILRVAQLSVDSQPEPPDICLIEVGGTVGDIECDVFLNALQQLVTRCGTENICVCHLSYIPLVGTVKEQKTRPTQYSVKTLRKSGLPLDFILCRCEQELCDASRLKISVFTQVPLSHVISIHDVNNIYYVPLLMDQQHIGQLICKRLGLQKKTQLSLSDTKYITTPLETWKTWARCVDTSTRSVKVGIVGKYTGLTDSYLSVYKALLHASLEVKLRLEVLWIESSELEDIDLDDMKSTKENKVWQRLKQADAVVCPGGFGDRGIIGKAFSARYCRMHNIPYLGICLGMQTAVIDFARHVLKLDEANSAEFNPDSPHQVIISMPECSGGQMGGSMRLGKKKTILKDRNSLAYKLYGDMVVYERHRHRYEVNPDYVPQFEAAGLKFVGQDEGGKRMEIAELQGHPYFLLVQFHPEFQSRPTHPSPPFLGLILSSIHELEKRFAENNNGLRPKSYIRSAQPQSSLIN